MAAPTPLEEFIGRRRRLFVLTGAGCSVNSGIPDYRDADGVWKRSPPVTYQAFMAQEATRRRYWARSLIGWRRISRARPNDAHRALARLEAMGKSEILLTQNVDRLHQAAGSAAVIDLHGRIDRVRCMGCERVSPRAELQGRTRAAEPAIGSPSTPSIAPDGDADLDGVDFSDFAVPACAHCGGVLKPDVVFFGENVPRDAGRGSASAISRRADAHADRRLVADGLFRLPLRRDGDPRRQARRRGQSRPHARR